MNWKIWQRRGTVVASPSARGALGITDPATQGFAAVALAIGQDAALSEPEPEPVDVPASGVADQYARLTRLREFGPVDEYHLELANGVVGSLRTKLEKKRAELADDRRASGERFAAQEQEIAAMEKTISFYLGAPEILGSPTVPELPSPKPKRARKPAQAAEPPAD